MAGLQIRAAVEADDLAIAEIGVRSWEAAYRSLLPDELLDALDVAERVAARRRQRRRGARERRMWVAERAGSIVGYASTGPARDADAARDTAEIYSLYVHPGAWSTGIGSALLRHATADLFARGLREVRLWCLTSNDAARRFYEHMGLVLDVPERARDVRGFSLPHTRYRLRRP